MLSGVCSQHTHLCGCLCSRERGKRAGHRLGLEICWRECGRTASFLVMNGNYHVGSHAFGSENMSSRWHIISLDFAEEYRA